jgi:branched-chain amino acid transport system substrate-binding protein
MSTRTTTWIAYGVLAVAASACGGEAEREPERQRRVADAVASPACGPVTYGGPGRPSALVLTVGTLQGAYGDHGLQNVQATKLVLARRGWRAGRERVGVQACDEASAASGAPSARKCARIGRAAARTPAVLAVVGPVSTTCALALVPVLNRAPGGGLPVVGVSATYLGLTRGGPGVAAEDPARAMPSGRRTFLRVVPADDVQAAAGVTWARDHGARRVGVVHDRSPFGEGLASQYVVAARGAGLATVGPVGWDPRAAGYRALAARLRAARVQGVLIAGQVFNNGPRLVADLRRALGERALLVAPDGFNQPATLVEGAGTHAEGLVLTFAALVNRALPPAGRRFAAEFERRYGQRPCCYAVHAAAAAEAVTAAIATSGGERRQVRDRLFEVRLRDGVLGDLRFDRFGDTRQTTMGVYRIEGGRLEFAGTVTPPSELMARR